MKLEIEVIRHQENENDEYFTLHCNSPAITIVGEASLEEAFRLLGEELIFLHKGYTLENSANLSKDALKLKNLDWY